MEAALDLTGLCQRLFRAYIRHQSTRENHFGFPVLDSKERLANCCDFGDVFAGQFGICPLGFQLILATSQRTKLQMERIDA
jgi:hypothetical protein